MEDIRFKIFTKLIWRKELYFARICFNGSSHLSRTSSILFLFCWRVWSIWATLFSNSAISCFRALYSSKAYLGKCKEKKCITIRMWSALFKRNALQCYSCYPYSNEIIIRFITTWTFGSTRKIFKVWILLVLWANQMY